jgi:large subunit ribosomal protein L22
MFRLLAQRTALPNNWKCLVSNNNSIKYLSTAAATAAGKESSTAAAAATARPTGKAAKIKFPPALIIEASKENIAQSPWKMNFLVKLVRGAWLPDALAQLKFSPKHRATDISKIVKRASAIAKIYHEAIPEELLVKEIFVTKGLAQKRMRIMGRGRTGIGYMRKSHVTVKVEKINF